MPDEKYLILLSLTEKLLQVKKASTPGDIDILLLLTICLI